MADSTPKMPIIDSHIHVYPLSQIDTLAWCKPGHPLAGQRSVEQYRAAADDGELRGFIFIETDRKNGDGKDWEQPLAEVEWLARIATGRARPGEGAGPDDAPLCLAAVPWAPVASGPDAVDEFLGQARQRAGSEAVWRKVRGVRFLVQDKPHGTMVDDAFIGSLRLLGRKGLVFDLGVDQHRRGRAQLEEAVDMIDKAHDGVPEDEKVVFILNHLCKPDLTIINPTDPAFIAWRTAMFTLSRCSRVYMKLSGLFAEMPEALRARPAEDIFMALYPWLAVLLAAFGPSRIMFGSDWPVCTVGVGDGAWRKWRAVVARMCYMASLSDEEQAMVWSGTAAKAYGIELDLDDE